MVEQILIGAVFILLVGSLVLTSWSPTRIFCCALLASYALGVVDTSEILDKVSNPGVMTLLIVLLVSMGLEKLNWVKGISGRLISKSYTLSLIKLYGVTAVASAFMNNTAVVATLAQSVRHNKYHPGSKLLIPLSYAAILGGTTTLIGTSTNLIVSSFLEDATGAGLAFFDFFIVGASAALLGLVTMLLTSRLLPSHSTEKLDMHAYMIETEVMPESPLVGKSVITNRLRDLDALFLVEIVRGDHLLSPVSPQEVIAAGDKLIFSGDITQLSTLQQFEGLSSFALDEDLLRQNLTEVIVMPNASIEGRSIKEAGFRALFDAAVVGLRRGGKRLSGKLGDIALQAGDNLVLAAGPDFANRKNLNKNFTVISDAVNPRLSLLQHYFLSISLFAAVILATFNILPLIKGLAFALAGMLLLGIVQGSELRRRFPFELVLIVISALVFSQALTNAGLTGIVANGIHHYLADMGPFAAVAGIFFVTLLMTETMTNTAAAALAFPIAFGLSESFNVNYMPFVMAVAYGASASFLTPYGYTTNLMVQNLGNYRIGDYLHAGLPVTVIYSLSVVGLIPIIYPF